MINEYYINEFSGVQVQREGRNGHLITIFGNENKAILKLHLNKVVIDTLKDETDNDQDKV